jgi:Flp pilus assembly protein TadG
MSRILQARSKGQALVEFAVVAPIFFLLLFGLIDLGRYVYVTNAFAQAAREGARYGSVPFWYQSCAATVSPKTRFDCIAQETRNRLAGSPVYYNVTVSCTTSDTLTTRTSDSCRADDVLKITIATPTTPASQRFTFFTPFIGQLVGTPVISATTQAIVQ